MKTDRELLELAAKAAGIEVPKKLNNWLIYDDKFGFQWLNMDGTKVKRKFNPLNDDGDALRLAVQLQIIVGKYDDYANAAPLGQSEIDIVVWSHQEKNPYAATRRAIVRAAAAIGEAMK